MVESFRKLEHVLRMWPKRSVLAQEVRPYTRLKLRIARDQRPLNWVQWMEPSTSYEACEFASIPKPTDCG